MKTLDLGKLWELCNILSNKEVELSEENKFISLLGNRSTYTEMSFESFLEYYSFKVEDDKIIVFNDDGIPWEDYTNNDFSEIPTALLSFSAEKLDSWIETEIKLELERQERAKVAEKENIKQKIEMLQKQLNKL